MYYIYSETPLLPSDIQTIIDDPMGDKIILHNGGSVPGKYYATTIMTNTSGYHYVWATDASTHTLGYELLIINE